VVVMVVLLVVMFFAGFKYPELYLFTEV